MADEKLAELWKTQKSLTEWFEDIKHKDTEEIRLEDNDKRERLAVLNHIINLPFDKPTQFKAIELSDSNKRFQTFLKEHGGETCALRLIPLSAGLPKLRMRGKTVADAYIWFQEQSIDPEKYRADYVPHAEDSSWSTIFIVNKHGIQGEIVFGGHSILTQGLYDKEVPIAFIYDYKTWKLDPENKEAQTYLEKLITYLKVGDPSAQKEIQKALGSTFEHDFIEGYFESVHSSMGTWFIDYSNSIGNMFKDLKIDMPSEPTTDLLTSGRSASPGIVKGKVKIFNNEDPFDSADKDTILVCEMTTPDFLPQMQNAKAIVTDKGGILCHAAIVARELKIPCVVGTSNATRVLRSGMVVIVDATKGVVTTG